VRAVSQSTRNIGSTQRRRLVATQYDPFSTADTRSGSGSFNASSSFPNYMYSSGYKVRREVSSLASFLKHNVGPLAKSKFGRWLFVKRTTEKHVQRCAEAKCLCWHKTVLFFLLKFATEARVGSGWVWSVGWIVDHFRFFVIVLYALLMFRVGPWWCLSYCTTVVTQGKRVQREG
jgi:hypothetical protein